MPTSLSTIIYRNLKRFKLIALFILFPLLFHAQTLTGLWVGVLSNDSNTVRKDQSFEIALTEYKGKVYGYSRSEFIVDEVLYYVVKRVKGTIQGDLCEVKDDEIIAFNFPGKLDKGVKVTSIFRRNNTDSTWYLDGTWKTNQTKNYYAVTGKVSLEEEKDLGASKIFPHLEELNLAGEIAFYRDRKEGPPIVKIAIPEKINRTEKLITEDVVATSGIKTVDRPAISKADPIENTNSVTATPGQKEAETSYTAPVIRAVTKGNSTDPSTAAIISSGASEVQIIPAATPAAINKPTVSPSPKKEEQVIAKVTIPSNEVAKTPVQEKNMAPDPVAYGEDIPSAYSTTPRKNQGQTEAKKTNPVVTKPVVKNDQPVSKAPSNKTVVDPPVTNTVAVIVPNRTIETNENWKESISIPAIPPVKTTNVERNGAAGSINDRRTEVSQVVNFRADSLLLSLYDNGQIDGDTVSVLMNGEVILAKQGLKASAIRKTIYLTPGKDDEFTLVLYAENLGSYPPNTGLLVVHDGEDVYNLRFSSDFQKNSAIVFRRKK